MLLLSVIPKITAHQNEIRQFGRFGLPESSALVCTVATLETLGAVLLIVGLLTRLAAAGLVANMIGAILTAGVHVGGPVHLGLGPVLLVASAYVAWAGPGALALDHRWPHQQPDAAIAIATAVSARAQPCVERRRDSQPRLQNPAPTGRTGQARPCEGVSLPGCTR